MTSVSDTNVPRRGDDGYREATEQARDAVCAECGAPLAVTYSNAGHIYVAVCGKDHAHEGVKLHRDVERDEMRERLNRDPKLAQALAVTGISSGVPLPTEQVRAMTQEQIANRVRVKFGHLREVTAEQRGEMIAMALRWGLDPVTDLTIYQERVYITYEGRLRKLRENTLLSPPKVEPLLPDDKELWGFDRNDLVYRCRIWKRGQAEPYEDFGVVRQDEIAKARAVLKYIPPVGTHPQLICLKRAVARCSRMATGIDMPTYDPTAHMALAEVEEVRTVPPRPSLEDATARARKRFWAVARDELGLGEQQVHDLLDVQSVSDYPGGYAQALTDLTEKHALRQEAELAHQAHDADADDPGYPDMDADDVDQLPL